MLLVAFANVHLWIMTGFGVVSSSAAAAFTCGSQCSCSSVCCDPCSCSLLDPELQTCSAFSVSTARSVTRVCTAQCIEEIAYVCCVSFFCRRFLFFSSVHFC